MHQKVVLGVSISSFLICLYEQDGEGRTAVFVVLLLSFVLLLRYSPAHTKMGKWKGAGISVCSYEYCRCWCKIKKVLVTVSAFLSTPSHVRQQWDGVRVRWGGGRGRGGGAWGGGGGERSKVCPFLSNSTHRSWGRTGVLVMVTFRPFLATSTHTRWAKRGGVTLARFLPTPAHTRWERGQSSWGGGGKEGGWCLVCTGKVPFSPNSPIPASCTGCSHHRTRLSPLKLMAHFSPSSPPTSHFPPHPRPSPPTRSFLASFLCTSAKPTHIRGGPGLQSSCQCRADNAGLSFFLLLFFPALKDFHHHT